MIIIITNVPNRLIVHSDQVAMLTKLNNLCLLDKFANVLAERSAECTEMILPSYLCGHI